MADAARIAETLALVRDGRGFEAHEVFEELWRAAAPAERDLYQGLVHVAVATYQDSRGNEVGRTRQLEKALRRLAPYAPAYEGIEIAARSTGAGPPWRRRTARRCLTPDRTFGVWPQTCDFRPRGRGPSTGARSGGVLSSMWQRLEALAVEDAARAG